VNVFIPAFLQQHIDQFGDVGAQWLAHLPQHVAALEEEWGCQVGPGFDHGGAVSWVAPVELGDGSEAVLKIGLPQEQARFEAQALRCLDGRGAVRLLQASDDGFSLLLERCLPGTDLWSLSIEEGNAVACRMLSRMWRESDPGAPFMPLSDFVAHWWDDLPRLTAGAEYEAEVVAEAVARGEAQPEDLTEDLFAGHLSTAGSSPPDLIIRTSGERRISNFLLWEAAYAEFVFQDVFWPDFGPAELKAAVDEYQRRKRRYGGADVSDVLATG